MKLRSETVAADLLRHAPKLRNADPYTARHIFVNPDLSPIEAKAAYELRKLRREKKASRAVPAVSGPAAEATHDAVPELNSVLCASDSCNMNLSSPLPETSTASVSASNVPWQETPTVTEPTTHGALDVMDPASVINHEVSNPTNGTSGSCSNTSTGTFFVTATEPQQNSNVPFQ